MLALCGPGVRLLLMQFNISLTSEDCTDSAYMENFPTPWTEGEEAMLADEARSETDHKDIIDLIMAV